MTVEPSCPHHDRIERKIDRLLVAVEGDEPAGHRGIVKRLTILEERTEWLYAKVSLIVGVAVAAFAIWKAT
jgi:hypothetical protein